MPPVHLSNFVQWKGKMFRDAKTKVNDFHSQSNKRTISADTVQADVIK